MNATPALARTWIPPVEVPRWHPCLRTSALLRLGEREADDLICLVNALRSETPGRPGGADGLSRVVADLWQCHTTLEIFLEPGAPDGEFFHHLRVTRGYLERAVAELAPQSPKADDPRNPVRATACGRLPRDVAGALGRFGVLAAERLEEDADTPQLVEDATRAAYLGAICDLGFLLEPLRDAGVGGGKAVRWYGILERQVEILRLTLPPEQASEEANAAPDEMEDPQEWPLPGGVGECPR